MIRIASVNQDSGISPERAKGAAVHLLAMRHAFRQLGCEIKTVDTPDPEALKKALAEPDGQTFDMLYERYALGRDEAARFAATNGIPYVLEINAPLADEAARYRDRQETAVERARDHFLFKQADCILAVSSQVAEYAYSRGASPDRVMVCPNGIDTERFHARVDGNTIRDLYVPPGHLVLGFHGRERPWHGFELLVSAFKQLLERRWPVHLMVVGHGGFEALSELPEGSYSRVGWQDHEDIPSFVAAFDLLPLTYGTDVPFYFSPLKLMEAMACGVVPIVPNLGDLDMIVEHENTGLVYRAGDTCALVDSLERLVSDADLLCGLGQGAANYAKAHAWIDIARAVLRRVMPSMQDQYLEAGK